MATTKKSKVKSPLNRKTAVKKASGKAKASPKPTKALAMKSPQRQKPVPRTAKKPVQKPISQKKAAKKAPLQAKAAKKVTPTAAVPKKDLVRKTVSTAPTHIQKAAQKVIKKPLAAADPKKPRFQKSDLDLFRSELLSMRDRITGQSGSMRSAALQRNDESNPEEDGTDAFMRLQTLEQVSSQHQLIANIDEALRSIDKGSYGVCDMCGELINKPRLAVLPFATNCVKCQSEKERVRRPGGRR